jgi:hypothetical protein
MGNYVPLADPEEYYIGPIRRSARHRVALNLLVSTFINKNNNENAGSHVPPRKSSRAAMSGSN